MKSITHVITISLLGFYLSSCSKLAKTTDKHNIYIAGEIQNAGSFNIPVYWKDSVMVMLPSPSRGTANSIFVEGNDVYVGGSIYTDTTHTPVIWINNVLTILSDSNGYVTDVKVLNGDVYALGTINMPKPKPVYWVNGILHYLSNQNGTVCHMFIAGNDWYAGGSILDSTSQNYEGFPVIWKNGNLIYQGIEYGEVCSVNVAGNDIYAAGSITTNSGNGAMSMKNGVVTQYSTQGGSSCNIIINNTDTYVSGYIRDTLDPTYQLVRVWKNNVPIYFFGLNNHGCAYASAMVNNELYTVGYTTSFPHVVLWKNGIETTLSSYGGISKAIFVK